jgi:hypothetical protein
VIISYDNPLIVAKLLDVVYFLMEQECYDYGTNQRMLIEDKEFGEKRATYSKN